MYRLAHHCIQSFFEQAVAWRAPVPQPRLAQRAWNPRPYTSVTHAPSQPSRTDGQPLSSASAEVIITQAPPVTLGPIRLSTIRSKTILQATIPSTGATTSAEARPLVVTQRPAPTHNAARTIVATFFPANYPLSVAPGYLRYTQWSFIHSVAGTVTGVLSMQSLLFAIGLGAGSIPLAAALNWIIKDGLGQLGGVLYASFMGEKFDSEPKRLRLTAAAAMQAASFLELLTPLFPHLFLPIASISNVGKNVAWLASSATRAQINQTFALHDNLGDITGKAGSQATAAGVVGTGLGVIISSQVGHDFLPILATFVPFSALTLWSVVQSNNAVVTRTLNAQRLDLILQKWSRARQVPTPEAVAVQERFVTQYVSPVRVNPPLTELVHVATSSQNAVAWEASLVGKQGFVLGGNKRVWMVHGAEPRAILRGYFAASMADSGKVMDDFDAFMVQLKAKGWHEDSVHVDQDVAAIKVESK
ncbi:vitamin B6 photo-protection and homoeostasis-domain-containing protein [Catenaria anguillulae PL171]|uniref:Vitamin B6 photo-protection and homoeostasis-domain-containing protein n=1 Tax=Catenaria anguillulae PL171 TaxID=765915 RepID=A0A1Y2HSA9_9FUNG|nr:vitamin B6 photo-protection and homoeostasis-domain-containing protein [Catenaria anguillulae PL171]